MRGEVRDESGRAYEARCEERDGWWEGLGLIREGSVQEMIVIVGGEGLEECEGGSRPSAPRTCCSCS